MRQCLTIEIMNLILSILAIFILLCISELGWRKHWFDNEVGRKFVHILAGTFIAFWPYFLSWNEIRFVSVAFLVVVVVSSQLKLFHAINSVQRPTFGDIFFAIIVGLLTFITHDKAVYAAALLQMSLADGFAAIIGTRYGRDNKYHLLGHNKSVAGTSAFVVISLAILIGFSTLSTGLSAAILVFGVLGAAFLENIAPFGLDNLFVPLFVGVLLANLH